MLFDSVFQINKGGLAIYGGILGGVAVVLIYCKVKKLSFWSLADTLIPSLVLGQAIGRWGNFVNQEAYGNLITNPDLQFFPYGVYIEELGQWHQATFFYESALNTLLLIAMLISYPHFRKKGYLLPFYMIGYGVIRCFVEGLRTDSLYLMPGVRVSQVLSGFHALLLDHSSFVFLCVLHPDLRRGRACCFLSAKNPERRWENVMIYLRLFLNFLMIGALSFGGGYGMVSLVRETVLSNGWLTENEFLNFIAVSESTPGPLAVNMATFIGSTQGGILGSFVATLGVVLPSFLIILLIASALKNLMKYAPVNAFLSGVRPCVVAMILATALSMALSTLFGLTDLQAGFAPDLRSIAVFAMLGATHLICKKIRKTAPSPILMILFSAGLGILFWCIF